MHVARWHAGLPGSHRLEGSMKATLDQTTPSSVHGAIYISAELLEEKGN
jgi:hypothetical protein